MKKKIVIGIVVFFMLVLLVPIRMQMNDGGSIQYRAVLYSVTKYHQITMEWDDENEEVADSGYRVGWGVEILGLEIFNNVKYVSDADSVRGEQTDFLKNISQDYTLEDARIEGCVCFDNGDITEGQKIWDEFVNATNKQEDATVRLAFYYSLDGEQCDPEYYESVKDEYPVLYIQELTYKDDSYTIRWFEEGEEIKKTYKYLMKYEGEPESETALYESYLRYVLTNDNTVTWEQIWRGLASSKVGEAIDHQVVYQKYNYNYNMQEYCNAKVLEIYEDCFLAECLDVTSGLLKTGTKVMVTKKVVAAAGVPELNTGDHIRIVYNGLKRTKTEEMKIVYAIYHLDENGEIISQ